MGIRHLGGVLFVRLFSALATALILPGAALADPGPSWERGVGVWKGVPPE